MHDEIAPENVHVSEQYQSDNLSRHHIRTLGRRSGL